MPRPHGPACPGRGITQQAWLAGQAPRGEPAAGPCPLHHCRWHSLCRQMCLVLADVPGMGGTAKEILNTSTTPSSFSSPGGSPRPCNPPCFWMHRHDTKWLSVPEGVMLS